MIPESTLNEYRAYAAKLAGKCAEALDRAEAVEQAARRVLAAVGDCASDKDAIQLYEGGKLLCMTGQDKEAMDSIIALWELVRPPTSPGGTGGGYGK